MIPTFETVVVGAGPAGLTAALYLARFRRQVLVIDGGDSRAAWIPKTNNHPGFPDGVSGQALLDLSRRQAQHYGARLQAGTVERLTSTGGGFDLVVSGEPMRAQTVLLACGVKDNRPDLKAVGPAIRAALLRVCPICDGYEVIDQRVGVIGDGPLGAREALFLTTYSRDVTLLHIGAAEALPAQDRQALVQAGVRLIDTMIDSLDLQPGASQAFCQADGGHVAFDALYCALGVTPRSRLARAAGARCDDEGRLWVDDHQQTSVPGLYAAGDMVRGLNQIATAQGEAAIAATAMHNRLRG